MSTGIAYSGGPNIQTDFAGDTRADIVAGLSAALLTANWTTLSGSGSDVTMRSALTPQGLECAVRIRDAGNSRGATIEFRNIAGTTLSLEHYLTHAVGKVFRVIANPYQFAAFLPNAQASVSIATFVMGGVPKLEDHMVPFVGECIWSQCDLQSSGSAVQSSFRTHPNAASPATNNCWQDVNGHLIASQAWGLGTPGIGKQSLVLPFGYNNGTNNDITGHQFINGEGFKTPARIAWGLTSKDDQPHIRGLIWDGVGTTRQYAPDITDAYDGHTFYNLTWPNNSFGQGGLWLVVPNPV